MTAQLATCSAGAVGQMLLLGLCLGLAAGVFVAAALRLAAIGLFYHAVAEEADRLRDRETCP